MCFLPVYTVTLCLIYQGTDSKIITQLIQYSKEIIILIVLVWLFISRKNYFSFSWKLNPLDAFFGFFILLCFVYLIAPIGEATFINKAVYFKNILLIVLMYYFGRISHFEFTEWKKGLDIIFIITIIAFVAVSIEKFTGYHLHSFIGYPKYHLDFNDTEMRGYYGLTWTFETEGLQKRFGSIFADPLDFSASLLISLSAALICLFSVRYNGNKVKYTLILLAAILSLLFAYSRASFVAFLLMLFYIGFILKYYKVLAAAAGIVIIFMLYVIFLAPDETRFFVEDTLLFQNSSSITHVIEWVKGIDAMIENPTGLGLATSGNIRGVEEELRVSGENQFIIYGVQLGWIGMFTYIIIIFLSIFYSYKAYRFASTKSDQVIPFIASTVKFGLLLPLMTANVEAYLYVSLISWWMVGYSINIYHKYKFNSVDGVSNA